MHLLRAPNFSEKPASLIPNTHTNMCVSGGKKCYFAKNFAEVVK